MYAYTDSLSAHEYSYLYYRIFNGCMVVCFAVPYIFAWYRVSENDKLAFSMLRYFLITTALLILLILSLYIAYKAKYKTLEKDVALRTKEVATYSITKKVKINHSNKCYFYVESPVILSFEVSEKDFNAFGLGDQINIEYATHSLEYLGYF